MKLAEELRCIWTSNPEEVPPSADFFFICIPDQEIPTIVREFQDRKGIWLHTAGALSMEVFVGFQSRYGVIYPLQSLSKKRPVSWEGTPFLIEASSRETLEVIRVLASSFTRNVHELNSLSRQGIHLAAVFANNFTNHMVHIAHQILMEHDIDVELLDPILKETFSKITEIGAADSQTGPALRDDTETMQKHLDLLKKHPEWKKLYTFISRDIGRSLKP